ncbi:TRAP transporter small permease [Oceanicola sp. S124]|uniref:TRAP transporter small permease n=1 Tax=Oceanicola sp. S124 TaxID=1042378 RepID=UPI0002558600|nr:TRAP transporter small permease subunit [Oceanicola sp. S124]
MARLIAAIETVAGLFLVLIAALTVTEAGLRYALGMRIPDAYMGATALQGIAIAWGIACTTWTRRHISVDAIYELSPPWLRSAMNVFSSAVTFVAMLTLMVMLWRKTASSLASGEVSADLLWPLWPVVAATAAGIAAASVLGLLRLGRDILDFRTG